ncbi:hypothetical protein TMES_06895 [Thalassospira mesophila]|uniref:Uncharacterized protein n=1 Tax=Thalassospira mesophila TaxID=1293891 RepID=A0A1Y2L2I7_9PROT|nr:hypothetical protein TMES_06895 [Thalassospira mesophila]
MGAWSGYMWEFALLLCNKIGTGLRMQACSGGDDGPFSYTGCLVGTAKLRFGFDVVRAADCCLMSGE